MASLFEAVRHGDPEHEAWLKQAITDHFAGRPIERPRGTGNRERAEALEAQIEAAEARLAELAPNDDKLVVAVDHWAERARVAEALLTGFRIPLWEGRKSMPRKEMPFGPWNWTLGTGLALTVSKILGRNLPTR